MNNDNLNVLPFLQRFMLAFEHATRFGVRVTTYSTSAGELRIRGATRNGSIFLKHAVTTDSEGSQTDFELDDVPIFLTAFDELTQFSQGSLYVTVDLIANGDIIHRLLSGYVYFPHALSFPAINDVDIRPGEGKRSDEVTTDPAAGSEIGFDNTGLGFKRFIAGAFTLVTDSTAQNRRVHFVVFNQDLNIYDCYASIDQPASQTYKYVLAPYPVVQSTINNNIVQIPIPPNMIIHSGDTFGTSTLNLHSGDNFSAMEFRTEKFLVPG